MKLDRITFIKPCPIGANNKVYNSVSTKQGEFERLGLTMTLKGQTVVLDSTLGKVIVPIANIAFMVAAQGE